MSENEEPLQPRWRLRRVKVYSKAAIAKKPYLITARTHREKPENHKGPVANSAFYRRSYQPCLSSRACVDITMDHANL
jgi:hypothetical protein